MFLISFKLVMFTLIVINTVFDVCSAVWVRTSNHQLCVLSVIHHVWLIGGMRGVPGEPRFKPRTFFPPRSPLHQCAALSLYLQKSANGIILLMCKYLEFTL